MTPPFSTRLRELDRAASAAPWVDGIGDGCRSIYAGPDAETVAEAVGQYPDADRANAALIVALRNRAGRYADLEDAGRALVARLNVGAGHRLDRGDKEAIDTFRAALDALDRDGGEA